MHSLVTYTLLLCLTFSTVNTQSKRKRKPTPVGGYEVTPPFFTQTITCHASPEPENILTDTLQITFNARLDLNPQSLSFNCSTTLKDARAANLRIYVLNVLHNETFKADNVYYAPNREWHKRCTRYQVDYRVPLQCSMLYPITHENLGRWMFRCDFGTLTKTGAAPQHRVPLPHTYNHVCTSEAVFYNVTFVAAKTTTTMRPEDAATSTKRVRTTIGTSTKRDRFKRMREGEGLPWSTKPNVPGPGWPWPNLLVDAKTALGLGIGSALGLCCPALLLCFLISLCCARRREKRALPCNCDS